jgi:hypothetical protein
MSIVEKLRELGFINIHGHPGHVEPYIADSEILSALGYTGMTTASDKPTISGDVHAGLLGNLHERKNRGRNLPLFDNGQFLRLLDTTGDPQLASQATLSCSLAGADLAIMPRVTGEIQWGTDGGTHEALFDFVHGTQLSVPADGIRLSALIEDNPAHLPFVVAGASVGYYPRGGIPPRRTLHSVADIDTNASGTYVIPAFASRVAVGVVGIGILTGPIITVAFLAATGVPMMTVAALTGFEASRSIPIPNGAASVVVTNLSDEAVSQHVIFDLSL